MLSSPAQGFNPDEVAQPQEGANGPTYKRRLPTQSIKILVLANKKTLTTAPTHLTVDKKCSVVKSSLVSMAFPEIPEYPHARLTQA